MTEKLRIPFLSFSLHFSLDSQNPGSRIDIRALCSESRDVVRGFGSTRIRNFSCFFVWVRDLLLLREQTGEED